jgi:hypothetical protein
MFPKHWRDFISENEDAATGGVFLQCRLFIQYSLL